MLQLVRTYTGCPAGELQCLVLPHETFIVYPSADSIVILNARTLSLIRVLAFGEVFPAIPRTDKDVSCVSTDSSMRLIVAAAGTRIAAWSLSGVQNDAWRIHSSLVLHDDHPVTTLYCQSGLIAVGSQSGLSVYTLVLENDLPTWSQKWAVDVPTPSLACFAPSLMYIATTSAADNLIRIYTTTSGRLTQKISHPRPVTRITWRHSLASSRGDLILYTVTSDSTLRIFLPVLDSPQHLQLHASLDLFSSLPFSVASEYSHLSKSTIFWLDRKVVGDSLSKILQKTSTNDPVNGKIEEIQKEGWDVFLRILENGSIVVTAVANLDSRPPTLLKQFTLQQSHPSVLFTAPSFLHILPSPGSNAITLAMSPPLATFDFELLAFLDIRQDGLRLNTMGLDRVPEEEREITRFVRTPDGAGVSVLRSTMGDTWQVKDRGSRLVRSGRWSAADIVVPLDGGRSFATYSMSDSLLTLNSKSPISLTLPPVTSLFSLPARANQESIIGILLDFTVIHIQVTFVPVHLEIISQNILPLKSPPKLILPVDPMAWSGKKVWTEHDTLLSVSDEGELAFWTPEQSVSQSWRCTGKVRTQRSGFRMVRCSSAKKSVIVVPTPEGEELTIWDSMESEFASGLEYQNVFSESITDLDWTSTPDSQSILAVGFAHHVDLLCQQRMTYFDQGPGWSLCWSIQMGNIVPYPISDSIWLTHGSLLVGANHQMYLFNQASEPSESLFEHVARHNGPLEDYHPQMLLQCLLWEKVELVKEIIMNLARSVLDSHHEKSDWRPLPIERFLTDKTIHPNKFQRNQTGQSYNILFDRIQEDEIENDEGFSRPLVLKLIEKLETDPLPHLTPNEHASLIVLVQTTLEIDELRRALDANGLRYLISMRSFYILNRRASAPSSPQSKGVISRQTRRRERLRYRDMIWAFHSESQDLLLNTSVAACKGKMCWSDARALGIFIWLNSFESMKTNMEAIARNEYMAGDNRDPTACSLFYFALGKVKLVHGLWRQAAWHKEQAVMLKFLSNDFTQSRWRTAALKNAYALLSKQRFDYAAAFFLLGGSLRDAVNVCIKQLSDFQLAVALARVVEQSNDGPILVEILYKTVLPTAFKDGNRWLGSWAFWLLHRRDLAVRILLTPLQDLAASLDIRVAEIGEPHYDDPSLALLFSQLKSKTLQAAKGTSQISGRSEFKFVLQMARVFCRMGCHVLALDIVRSWSFERPSTVIRGLSEASPILPHERSVPPSPVSSRRSMFALEPAMRRRSSILIDMDILTAPPTRTASPESKAVDKTPLKVSLADTIKEDLNEGGDLLARQAGLGSLMKSAKQDVQVPEFDMNSFGF